MTTPSAFIDLIREASLRRTHLEEQLMSIEKELSNLSHKVEEAMWKAFHHVKGKEVKVLPPQDAPYLQKVKETVHSLQHLLEKPDFYSEYESTAYAHSKVLGYLAYYNMLKGNVARAKLYINRMDITDPQNRAVMNLFHSVQVIPSDEKEFISFCNQLYGGVSPIVHRDVDFLEME